MSDVYSTRFLASNLIAGTATYTVPEGYRAVVHSITAVNNSSHATYAFVTIETLGVAIWIAQGIPTLGFAGWNGRQVVNEGEQLLSNNGATDGGVAIICSGYLLTLP
jgi:hypothetical protein